MRSIYLTLSIVLAVSISASAQSALSTDHRNEYAAGTLLFWENNTSTVGVGLQQMYRRALNPRFNVLAGLSAIRSIPDWHIDAGFSSHSVLLTELGVQMSPFSPQGRFRLGLTGEYRYGTESYSSISTTTIDNETGAVQYSESYDTDLIRQAGYGISASYQGAFTERLITHTTLQMHNFNYFGEMFTFSFQVGYRF